MKQQPIKVGFCVAYDWYFLKNSLPLVYDHADTICLALDKDRISWAGKKFDFDEVKFKELISNIDLDGKIQLYEDDFHLTTLSPMQNEVRQRNKMAEFLGVGGWHIQLDADEYFVDFSDFVEKLQKYKGTAKVNICVPWVTLFKQTQNNWLYVDACDTSLIEYIPVATKYPQYEYGRRNGYFNYKLNHILIHQSWARTLEEIKQKISNWGHKNDFNTQYFLEFWQSLNELNFSEASNFHPIVPHLWPSLKLILGSSVQDVVNHLKKYPPSLINDKELKRQNSLIRSRLKAFLNKMGVKE